MKVLVGTASWSDKSLVGSKRFYPRQASTPEGRLRFYATQFPLVEVDTSYYATPFPETAQAWADRTPEHLHDEREGVPALHRSGDLARRPAA